MSEWNPVASSIVPDITAGDTGDLALSEVSLAPLWRVFSGFDEVRPGTSKRSGDRLVWSVSPHEWTIWGERPQGEDVVDLSHVRVMFRLTGAEAPAVLAKICALDLGDAMFPNGAAARTLVAGVATELVRDDQGGVRSYLILPSRSFARYLHDVILDAGEEFGLV